MLAARSMLQMRHSLGRLSVRKPPRLLARSANNDASSHCAEVVPESAGEAAEKLQSFVLNAADAMLGDYNCSISIALCSSERMRSLNNQWLGHDFPTDVLSFPSAQVAALDLPPDMSDTTGSFPDSASNADVWLQRLSSWWASRDVHILKEDAQVSDSEHEEAHLADGDEQQFLGDLCISVPHVKEEARSRGHPEEVEAAVLLAHGVAHLMGEDHELGDTAAAHMRVVEDELLLKCVHAGLIPKEYSPSSLTGRTSASDELPVARYKALVLDLDGTLLTSSQEVSKVDRDAVQRALDAGLYVCPATGKARPSAQERLHSGSIGSIASESSPGVFLQGLLVQGLGGEVVHRDCLPVDVVRSILAHDFGSSVGTVAFAGDICVCTSLHRNIKNLHLQYGEPLAQEHGSVDATLDAANQAVSKLLLYADSADEAQGHVRETVGQLVDGKAAITTALPEMVEVVPLGSSKGAGVTIMLQNLGLEPSDVVAIGDGENDVELLSFAGHGIAVANASDGAKRAADTLLSRTHEDGAVAEAVDGFVLPNVYPFVAG